MSANSIGPVSGHELKTKTFPSMSKVQGLESQPDAHLRANFKSINISIMTELQNLFVTSESMDIFQMTLKLSLFTVD